MVAAARKWLARLSFPRHPLFHLGIWLAALALPSEAVKAQAPAREDGLFITIRNPITSDVVENVKAKTRRALERTDRHVRTFIFDFNPGQESDAHPSGTKEYGPCHDLAAYLLTLQEVKTVAFVHNDVTAHTVLPVLACTDIVMSAEAKLGNVAKDLSGRLLDDEIHFYENVARSRGLCPAIVLKMLDRDMEVLEATRQGAVWYVDKRRQAQEAQQGAIVTRQDPVLLAGNYGFYIAAQAKKFGLCKLVKENRPDVAEAYQLTASSLREDPLEGRDPKAYRILINEPISKAVGERLRRQIRRAIAHRANLLVFQLESSGGDPETAVSLAEFLRTLRDDRGELPVMTIAYIPERAPGAATLFALGCSEIVMGKSAQIGDFDSLVHAGKGQPKLENYEVTRDALVELAREQGYSPLLARGMLDEGLTIYQVQSRKGQAEWKLIDKEEWDRDQAPAGPKKWDRSILIKPAGKLLKLDAETARRLGLAHEIVEDFSDLARKYGLKNVPEMGYDFLYRLAEFLGHPVTAVFLIMIGIACLILELKLPGVSLPGVIAAVCFVLYFWAQSQLTGQITTLAILLFILGLILIGLEIFLLPGSVIMGLSGVVLVVLSLALATLEKRPETQQEWFSFGQTLGAVGVGLVGAVGLAFLTAWYLPNIPYASRLILKPPGEVAAEETFEGEEPVPTSGLSAADLASLLGAIGVASTTLRPAGIARFGDDFVDVVSEGSFIEAGSRIQVIEIEGHRVVVKEV
jgi:membrane-bound ClpP family serine protease